MNRVSSQPVTSTTLAPSRRRYSARSGPVALSWPDALELLSAELGEPVTCKVAPGRQFLDRLTGAGIPAGTAELLITREWAILAGENDYTTGTSAQVTGRPPRPVAEFLHQYRAEFT